MSDLLPLAIFLVSLVIFMFGFIVFAIGSSLGLVIIFVDVVVAGCAYFLAKKFG